MTKQMLTPVVQLPGFMTLYRDTKTGIAWIEDGGSGTAASLHPNIDATGSIRGMKNLGYWKKEARCVRACGYIYNIDSYVPEDNPAVNQSLLAACRCGGYHGKDRA